MEKERTLKIYWSKREQDFMVQYPRRCDGSLIQSKIFGRSLIFDYLKFLQGNESPYNEEVDIIEELERRGYDKTTLKFQIKLKTEVIL